jgi:hypothetical protein
MVINTQGMYALYTNSTLGMEQRREEKVNLNSLFVYLIFRSTIRNAQYDPNPIPSDREYACRALEDRWLGQKLHLLLA